MKKYIAITQPYFLPYYNYWKMLNLSDVVVILNNVNFKKKGFIHRNNFLVNGSKKLISLKISNSSQNKKIRDLKLLPDKDFKQTLLHNYKSSKNFKKFEPYLDAIFSYPNMYLDVFLINSIKVICSFLKINKKIILETDIKETEKYKGEEKIIFICKYFKIKNYLNLPGGKNIYNSENFIKNNLSLNFLDESNYYYSQKNKNFVKNLSIIDAIMNDDYENLIKTINHMNL